MRRTIFGTIAGVAAAGVATGIGVWAGLEGEPGALVLHVLAVVVGVTAGGLIAGLLTAAASWVLASWFLLTPTHSFTVDAGSAVALVVFAVTAGGIAYLLDREQRATARFRAGLSERQRLVDELAASEKQVSAVVETSVDGIVVIDERGVIERFNPASEGLFGYAAEEVIGQDVSMLMPEPYASEHGGYISRYLLTRERRIIGLGREVLGRRKDGSTFPFELSVGEAIVDGRRTFTGVIHDLSARRQAEEELEAHELELALVLEGAQTGTWRWDIAGDVIRWSENLGPLHGLPTGTQPSTYEEFLACIHPDDRELLQSAVERSVVAGLDYSLEFRTRWPDGTVRWLETRAHVLRDGDGKPAALLGLSHDVTERKQREQAQRLLADASTLLASTLDYQETLQSLAGLTIGELADWCMVHVVEPDGRIELVAVAHADPERVRLARRLDERYPVAGDAPVGVAAAIRTGRSQLHPAITDSMLAETAGSAEHLEILRMLGLRSGIVAPIALRSRIFGTVTLLAAESGRTYDETDVAFAEELARRAALAVDNALLHEAERDARAAAQTAAARALRLQAVIALLAEAATSEEIAHVLVREGAAALEADAGVVYLVEGDASDLVLVAQDGYPQWFVDDYGRVAQNATSAAALAARTREPRWYSSAEEYHEAHPEFAASFDSLGYRALAFLPLVTRSEVLGVVGFSFTEPRAFAADEREHLVALAGQCALAVERARLYERERGVAVTLQQSLLPRRLPAADGVELAVRYLPGSRGLEVGGDWFDAIPLPDGRLGISIGDVVGRGARAAATMAPRRNALRAYALEGFSPAGALQRLDNLAERLGEGEFATALYLELDPVSGSVCLANAGHLPPLLLEGGGSRLLEGGRSMPLGIEASVEREEEGFDLAPGATLVLYTDGLVEARAMPLGNGLAKLLDVAADAPRDPNQLVDHLLEELGATDVGRHDDVAVLAIRLEPEPVRRLELHVEASPTVLASVRAQLRDWLAELDVDEHETMSVLVATGEACANAIEHPLEPLRAEVRLEARVDEDGELDVRIRDAGGWREPQERPGRGLGLPLMERLMDEVDVVPSPLGTEVRLRRRLRSAARDRLPASGAR